MSRYRQMLNKNIFHLAFDTTNSVGVQQCWNFYVFVSTLINNNITYSYYIGII